MTKDDEDIKWEEVSLHEEREDKKCASRKCDCKHKCHCKKC